MKNSVPDTYRDIRHVQDTLWQRFIVALYTTLFNWVDWHLTRSGKGDTAIFDPCRFSWIEDLILAQDVIRRELADILPEMEKFQNVHGGVLKKRNLVQEKDKNKWKTFPLYSFGIRIEGSCQRCPETVKLVQKIPGMESAIFSILYPDTYVEPHHGEYKGILRFHLPLIVPEGKRCGIKIDGKTVCCEVGKPLVFNHTHLHEAWNRSDQIRVVLLIDFHRKMPFLWSVLGRIGSMLKRRTVYVRNLVSRTNAMHQRIKLSRPKMVRNTVLVNL